MVTDTSLLDEKLMAKTPEPPNGELITVPVICAETRDPSSGPGAAFIARLLVMIRIPRPVGPSRAAALELRLLSSQSEIDAETRSPGRCVPTTRRLPCRRAAGGATRK